MSIYIFTLLVGYELSGVDHAIGKLHAFFKKTEAPLKYVFSEIPSNEALKRYTDMGIDWEDIICAQFSVAGNAFIGGAQIQTQEHHSNNKLVFLEAATDRPLYIDYFCETKENSASVTLRSRRTVLRQDGSVAFDIIYDKQNNERYVFPDGEVCSTGEFLLKSMQSFCFSEDDLIIIHRPGHMDFIEPLFLSKHNAHTLVFFHSGHEFFTGEDPYFYGLNPSYFYFLENADKVDAILVSTNEQRNDVINAIDKYHFPKANVEALPIFGIKERKEFTERKPFSLVTVSRLEPVKHIDLLIRASIEVHKIIPELILDIYGTGSAEYISMLETLIENANASSYITLKGYCDVSDVYDNYEAYISASTRETLGITLMEAISAGNAMIGFRARYGNTLFIHPDENGYLVDVDFSRLNEEHYQNHLVSELALKIQLLFEDSARLSSFHKASYALSKVYSIENIEKMWIDYIGGFKP